MDADELVHSFSPVDGLFTSNVVEVVTSLPLIQSGTGPEKVSWLPILMQCFVGAEIVEGDSSRPL